MKRIDLHLHTQNLKGDGAKRVIDTKGFVKKMDSNGIGICAITNHNHFDVEEFRTIKAAKHDFVIFTGIELDVVVTEDADSRHIIVIGDPDNEEQFKEVFSGKKEDAKELCLNYDAFITSRDLIKRRLLLFRIFSTRIISVRSLLKKKIG